MDYGNSIRIDSETYSDGIEDGPPKMSDSSDTTSSSSSDSASNDLFLVNHPTLIISSATKNIPKPIKGTRPLQKNNHIDISNEALYKLEECVESPESTSRFSDITHESLLLPSLSPTQSPPIQVMEKGFDPNRIPASVFSGPSTPMDWSVASNESLFSIRIGNNSFNKDRVLKTSVEVQESGELRKSTEVVSEELYSTGEIDKSQELNQSEEVFKSGEVKRADELVSSKQSDKGVVVDSFNEPVIGVTQVHKNNKKLHVNFVEPRDSAIANKWEKSEHVIQISAFTKKKSSCPICHCFNCCHALYCCKKPSCSCNWPSCCFKWSSCSCKWLSCSTKCCSCPSYSTKCFSWPSCSIKCFSWPSCSGNCFSCKGCQCNLPNCCCRCPSFRFKCPSWPSCNFKCLKWSSCTWTCCSCWKCKPKKSRYREDQHTTPPISIQASSRRRYSCFSCSSSCSCCSCYSSSCCS